VRLGLGENHAQKEGLVALKNINILKIKKKCTTKGQMKRSRDISWYNMRQIGRSVVQQTPKIWNGRYIFGLFYFIFFFFFFCIYFAFSPKKLVVRGKLQTTRTKDARHLEYLGKSAFCICNASMICTVSLLHLQCPAIHFHLHQKCPTNAGLLLVFILTCNSAFLHAPRHFDLHLCIFRPLPCICRPLPVFDLAASLVSSAPDHVLFYHVYQRQWNDGLHVPATARFHLHLRQRCSTFSILWYVVCAFSLSPASTMFRKRHALAVASFRSHLHQRCSTFAELRNIFLFICTNGALHFQGSWLFFSLARKELFNCHTSVFFEFLFSPSPKVPCILRPSRAFYFLLRQRCLANSGLFEFKSSAAQIYH
jgi:hypothetical protein